MATARNSRLIQLSNALRQIHPEQKGTPKRVKIPAVGVEPTLPFENKILSLARLPISPRRPYRIFPGFEWITRIGEKWGFVSCWNWCRRDGMQDAATQTNGVENEATSGLSCLSSTAASEKSRASDNAATGTMPIMGLHAERPVIFHLCLRHGRWLSFRNVEARRCRNGPPLSWRRRFGATVLRH